MICINKIPLFNNCYTLYTGGICHKQYFIFLSPLSNEIHVYNHCLEKIGCIKSQHYQSITENKEECYFILSKEGDKDHLYKTTYDFVEFDCIKLIIPQKYKEEMNDIYYDENQQRIFIATTHYLYSVTLDGYFIKEECAAPNNMNGTSPTVIRTLSGCCVPVISPKKESFAYTSVGKCDHLYISYIKNNQAYLSLLSQKDCACNQICLGEDIRVVSIISCHNKLYLLIIQKEKYNYLYETDICCTECHRDCWDYLECEDDHVNCHPCPPPKPHPCKDPTACLLESVALVETSLSHILNAEGEKIQKAIEKNVDIKDLLKINCSVTDTIFNATMLEHVLQQKIEKALCYDEMNQSKHCHEKSTPKSI